MRDYKVNYVVVDDNKQRDHQCNSICIINVKKTKERVATEAEVDIGEISLFGAFSPSSHGSSGNPLSPPPRCNSGGNRHGVDDNEDEDEDEDKDKDEDDDEDVEDAGGEGGGGRGGR
jgi:hypothetical protein